MGRAGRGLRGAAARLSPLRTPPPGRAAGAVRARAPRGAGQRLRRRGAAARSASWPKRPGDPPAALQTRSRPCREAPPGHRGRWPATGGGAFRRLPPRPGQTPDGRRGGPAVPPQHPFARGRSRVHGAELTRGEAQAPDPQWYPYRGCSPAVCSSQAHGLPKPWILPAPCRPLPRHTLFEPKSLKNSEARISKSRGLVGVSLSVLGTG